MFFIRVKQLFVLILSVFLLLGSINAYSAEAGSTLSSSDKEVVSKFADMLENEKQRDVVIEQLRTISGQSAAAPSNSETSTGAAKQDDAAVASDITEVSQKIVDQSTQIASEFNSQLQYTISILYDVAKGDWSKVGELDENAVLATLKNILILLVIAVVFYQLIRLLSRPFRKKLNNWSLESDYKQPLIRRVISTAVAFIIDAVFIGASYLVIKVVATYVLGSVGTVSTQATLFIKAFIYVEVIKLFVRLLFYPVFSGLGLLSGNMSAIRYWYRWMCNIVNLVGYGFLLVIPLIQSYLHNKIIAQVLGTIIAVITFFYGLWAVIRYRKLIKERLKTMAGKTSISATRSFLQFLAVTWHYFAVAYFIMLTIVMIVWPEDALPFVLKGTAKTVLIIVAGLLLSTLLTSIIEKGIRLPASWEALIPGIEKRINAYVPIFLKIIRFALLVAAVLLLLSVWEIIDFPRWVGTTAGAEFIHRWTRVFWILVLSAFFWILVSSIIESRLNSKKASTMPSARAETLLSLAKNALAILIIVVTVMMTLSQIGIDIAPLIAGAGVIGLAVGFGAQTLVKDVITGVFIQLENAINKGDYITAAGVSGTAERITIRSVALRDIEGTYHIVPFSSVSTVSNYMREFAYHKGEYGISYNENIDFATEQLKLAFEQLKKEPMGQYVLDNIELPGVSALADSSINIRVLIRTSPGYQWAVGRAFNRLVKMQFDKAGIELAFPHRTIYFGIKKDKSTPPLNIRTMAQGFDENGLPLGNASERAGNNPVKIDSNKKES